MVDDKLAGILGTTDLDELEAIEAGAAPTALLGTATGVPLLGMLGYRSFKEEADAPDFGDLGTLIKKVKGLESSDLPDKLRLYQGIGTPFVDYAAMPDLSTRLVHGLTGGLSPREQAVMVPWSFRELDAASASLRDPRRSLLGLARGEKLNLIDDPGPAGVVGKALAEAKDEGRGAMARLRRAYDKYQKVVDPLLTAPGDVIARRKHYSPSAVLHELGHISGSHRKWPRGLWGAAIAGGMGAGLGTAAALSDNEALQYASPAIALAPSIPTLIEEARATRGGGRFLREMVEKGMADPGWLKKFKRLTRPAYATYAVGAALPALAAGITAHEMMERRDRGFLGDIAAKIRNLAHGAAEGVEDVID